MYAAALITGCGGGSTPVDGGLGDPVAPATCAIDNGGCSISPMVQCSLGGDGEAQCAACPPDYVGDGRVCTSTSAMDECTLGTHNCSPDATCTDTATAYLCECLDGFFGNGVFFNTGECAHATSWVQYQLTGFSIPTLEQAARGDAVGHNVDYAGDRCGVADFAGNVDNSLIALAASLLEVTPQDPIDLHAVVDNALSCPADSMSCMPPDPMLLVEWAGNCALLELVDASGDTLAGPFVATLNVGGDSFRQRLGRLDLAIPYNTGTASTHIAVSMSNVVIEGTLRSDGVDFVVGGVLSREALESSVSQLLALRGGDVAFEDVSPILEGLYDVQLDEECSALSVGFTGSGTRYDL